MNNILIYLFRKIKANFVRFRLHIFIEPFSGLFLNIFYLSKYSKWKSTINSPKFDDFYNSRIEYNDRYKLYKYILKEENLDDKINYFEFGVSGGDSFKWWTENIVHPESRFYGFDTFSGLPEDYGILYRKGTMSSPIPAIKDKRSEFIAGKFQDTLPDFIKNFNFNLKSIIHCDADLYSSTLFVLANLAPFLKKNDIIIFDEFSVPTHEFKAFYDFTSAFNLKYEIIGAVNNYLQVVIKIL